MRDLGAGLIVAFVAVPLCIGIAMASQASPAQGLLSGIVAGLTVPLLSRARVSISGPAAGLIVLVADALRELSPIQFSAAVIAAGLTQILLGMLRGEALGAFIPNPVIYGMLAGIGGTILVRQTPHVLGYQKGLAPSPFVIQTPWEGSLHLIAMAFGIGSLLLFILWELPWMPARWQKRFPGPLIALMGSGLALGILHWLGIPPELPPPLRLALPEGGLPVGFYLPEALRALPSLAVLRHGVLIGIVASLETFVTAEAIDKIDPHRWHTPKGRELYAQGLGNIVAGSVGALPITMVIIRSTAAIHAGGKSRWTPVFHSVFLAIFAWGLAPWLNHLPLASISAIILVVGYKLLKPSLFRRFARKGFLRQFVPFFVTFAGVVLADLLTGILIGLGVAAFLILRETYRLGSYARLHRQGSKWELEMSEQVTFLNKAHLVRTLSKVPPRTHLIIDLTRTRYVDADIIDTIREYAREVSPQGITVELRRRQRPSDTL